MKKLSPQPKTRSSSKSKHANDSDKLKEIPVLSAGNIPRRVKIKITVELIRIRKVRVTRDKSKK